MTVFVFILVGLFCLQQSVSTPRLRSSSRTSQRFATVELRLDAINYEITNFRADIAEITDSLYQLNSSCSCNEQVIGEILPPEEAKNNAEKEVKELHNAGKEIKELNNAGKSTEKEFKERIYLAFQAEKKAMLDFQEDIVDKLQDHKIYTNNVSEITVNRINARITATEKMAADIDTQIQSTNAALVEQISDLEIQLSDYKIQLADYKTKYQKLQNQINSLHVCPSNWYQHWGSCYYISSVAKSWYDAAEWCRSNDAFLVEYNNMNEVNFVLDMAKTLRTWSNNKWESFYIGAHDRDVEGTFITSYNHIQLTYRNKPLTSAGIHYWLPGQPDNGGNREDCLATTVNQNGRWNDMPCGNNYLFVCEKKLF